MSVLTFRIKEMDCAEEVALLTRALTPLVGQEDRMRFDILGRKLSLDASGLVVTPEQVIQAVAATGMNAETIGEPVPSCACCGNTCEVRGGFWTRWGRETLCLASGLLWVFGMTWVVVEHGSFLAAFRDSSNAPLTAKLAWGLAACVGVWQVLPKALHSLRSVRPDMNLLMVLAVAGAMVIGDYAEGASVAFLFSLANLLEAVSVGRARKAIEALMNLTPDTALVLSPEASVPVSVPVNDVPAGSRILVRPGDRVPLDGLVRSGSSALDQSPITGESMPVAKNPGDEVYAGSINTVGALEVEATRPASQSMLARIMRMVEEAQSRRAKTAKWVEKFAAVYTPVMVGVSTLFAVVPPLFFGGAWETWFYEALVILVISCPCALVISTPVTIVAALASAARNGVLIKGGVFLEIPATLNAMAMDKTGTLTHGRPLVTAVESFGDVSEAELMGIAASLESLSNHPVARAVVRHAASLGVVPTQAEDVVARLGLGVQGRIRGRRCFVGNLRYLAETGNAKSQQDIVTSHLDHKQLSGTEVLVWTDGQVLGRLTVEDKIRAQSPVAMAELKDLGVKTIVMLTGDNEQTAQRIAAEAGVGEYRADLLPQDKISVVADLAASGFRVGMVGDGVNDAPAMAASHLGIAMGSIGTDAAMETADVVLMSDDLTKLPWLIRHSRRTIATIRANIWFALGVKAVFLLLAALQMATLWTAILADLGSSLLVIFNGLRLLRIRPIH